MYPYARSFLNTYGGMVVGGGLIVTVVYLVKTLSSTARGLLNLQENLVVYLGYASGGVLVVLAAAGIRSKYALSAKMAHRIAHRLIIRSEDPVLQSKLGGNIRIDRMRVVSRAGGYPKIQWPATMEERSKAESVCYKLIAEYEAAAESRGMNKNSSMIQQMRESLLDARRRLIGALDSAHIPSLKYKPPRAFLVFPLKGKLDRAMVSTEVVKNSGGFFGGSSYSFKLLAVDFKDSEYMLLVGNQKKYEGGVISQLRLPMLTLLTKGKPQKFDSVDIFLHVHDNFADDGGAGNTIAEQEEAEDDGMPGL